MKSTFVLYLRPFHSDGRVTVANPEKLSLPRLILPTAASVTPARVGLEEILLKSTPRGASLVAIGQTVEVIGAGKITSSDEDWKDYFRKLAAQASCIISVPSLHTSTIWELEWIALSRLETKLLMVFTPLHFDPREALYCIDTLRQALKALGLMLPTGLTSSSLVTFLSGGLPSLHIPDSLHKTKRIADAVGVIGKSGDPRMRDEASQETP